MREFLVMTYSDCISWDTYFSDIKTRGEVMNDRTLLLG